MQDPQLLSTHYRSLRTLKPIDTTDERLEDQLDRLNVSVQQVLSGARQLQLDDLDYSSAHVSATITPRYRLPPEFEDDLEEAKTYSEDEESLEIIEYLAGLLEKTQMEAEDIRAQGVRMAVSQTETLSLCEQQVINEVGERLGLPKGLTSVTALVTEVQSLLGQDITCSMDQLCACEMSLCELLQSNSSDAEVALNLGSREFRLTVKRSGGDMLSVAKHRLASNIGQPLLVERQIVETEEPKEQIQTTIHNHQDCERVIEELQLRLEFMREQVLPAEIFTQVEQERLQLRRAEHIRKQEIERLESKHRELEVLRTTLKTQLEEVKIVKELLIGEQQTTEDLKTRLTQERFSLQEKAKSVENERLSIAAEKENLINFASQQGSEVMTLKQKIEHMIQSHSDKPDDVRSIPESLPDGELRDFDLRIKQMTTLIEKGDISSEIIQKELEELEEELSRVNPRRSGVRRLKIQLNSAKNKLMGLKSKQAIASADRMMTNLNSSIQALEKTWKQEEVKQSPSKVMASKPVAPRKPAELLFPVTPTKSYDLQTSPTTEIKDPYGKWMNYTETIRNQEHVIAKLKKQLLHAAHKYKDLENREIRLGEKEAFLKAVEKQLEALNQSLEKRVKAITVKETGLKSREVSLLEAADAENTETAARALYIKLDKQVREEEVALTAKSKEIEHERMKVLAMREETMGREKHLAKVQRNLARENLRMEKEKKKLESLRQELSHLLPSLQTLARSKE